jgi:prepilin-type N-terminal cleavage/methylation domain-containing protein
VIRRGGNDEIRMVETVQRFNASTWQSHSPFPGRRAFTLIELIVAVTVIVILVGLVLSTVGYVQKKGARARAETEIAAISAACESYKADNGIYPQNGDTNTLDPTSNFDSSPPPPGQANAYSQASLYLYEKLFGVTSGTRSEVPSSRSYFSFKPNMLYPTDTSLDVVGLRDPFGNLYGYSTSKANGGNGYNPTFDLWSTASDTSGNTNQWIKNW